MKKYLNSLLPFRWIYVLLYFAVMAFTFLYLGILSHMSDGEIFLMGLGSLVFTIFADLVAGIGRVSPLFKKLLDHE